MSALKFVLYTNSPLKDGTCPVRLRTYFGRERYISLGISCKPEQWNRKTRQFNKKMDGYEAMNVLLRNRMNQAKKILAELGEDFTYEKFKQRFTGKYQVLSVNEFLDQRIEELEKAKKIGNREKYVSLKNMLAKYGATSISFKDVDYNFLKGLETFILGMGSKPATVHFYMRTLRALFNEAIRRGFVEKERYPFSTQFNKDGYKFSHMKSQHNPKPLTLPEMELLKAFPYQQHPHLQHSYDLFMFLVRARGINFVDACELTVDNIIGNRLNYVRQKTGKLYSISISPEMREIIDRYKENYLFPIMKNAPSKPSARYHHIRKALKVFNEQLKEIAEVCGIRKKITSYTARYSYTNILVRNGVSVPQIQQALGHSDISTTQHYIAKYAQEEIDKLDSLI